MNDFVDQNTQLTEQHLAYLASLQGITLSNSANRSPQNTRAIRSKLSFSAKGCKDPIPPEEKDKTAFDPDIDNDGGCLERFETGCLTLTYATEDEKECLKNAEEGHGFVTDSEYCRVEFYKYEADIEPVWLEPPPKPYYTFHEPIIKEEDGYIDDGMSCTMIPADLGASLPEQDSTTEEPAPEDTNAPTFTSSTEPPVETEVDVASAFNAAAPVPDAIEPEPEQPAIEQAPVPPQPNAAPQLAY